MKMNKIPKLITSAAALSSILALSPLTTAFAVEVNETTETTSVISSEVTVVKSTLPVSSDTETTTVTTDITTRADEKVEISADSGKVLPSGNGTLLENVFNDNVNRQFLTIQSKNGNTFYIIVDKDKEGGGNVYFMNLVDEYDLMAFTDKFPNEDKDGSKKKAETAITDIDDETPTAIENGDNELDSSQTTETAKAVSVANTNLLFPAIGILALLGGAAFYFFKLRGPSANNDKKRDSDDEEDDIDNGEIVNENE
ncbi:CD1107 family mobile element protein [Ruminococcus flavefaciens]|uniref:CD1107 family mobile element protein n=1 Tax=Ruminococcus flavefaciens TaxID=1265 RepID=UPI0003659CE3|nr:DUF4366 domain-containing protein [Ruminococcus flavefaciens]